jgi:GNAT superfamily N-acetyltransferase
VDLELRKISSDELRYVSYLCLWGVSRNQKEAMKEHMEKRLKWIEDMMPRGLEIVVAFDQRKSKRGLIEYLPIEIAPEPVKGENSLFIDCIWVLSRFSKVGIGKGLMQCLLKEARNVGGATVLAYEGDKWFGYFDYMPANFFEKFGFEEVSRDGTRVLLHLDLGAHQFPRLITPRRREIGKKDKIILDVFCNRQCPWCGWMVDNIQKNVAKNPDVTVNVINTDSGELLEKFGIARGVSVNGQPVLKRMAPWKEIKKALKRYSERVD